MKITRLSTGPDNRSYFEDIEVPFESREDFGLFTLPEPAKAVFFREIPPGWVYSWHNVVCREYVVTVEGEAEIEVGSGEKRVFRRGRCPACRRPDGAGAPDPGDREEGLAAGLCHAAVMPGYSFTLRVQDIVPIP